MLGSSIPTAPSWPFLGLSGWLKVLLGSLAVAWGALPCGSNLAVLTGRGVARWG